MTAQAPVRVGSSPGFRPPPARDTSAAPAGVGTAVAALCGLLLLVPWQTESTRTQLGYLDFSWVWALSDAFAHGRIFGRDLVFTAGPLGFLGPRAFVPETGALLWIWWTAIALVWSALLWRQLARSVANPALRIGLFAWSILCAALSSDAFFLAIPILAGAIAVTRANDDGVSIDMLGVSSLLAVGALVKFSFLVAGAAAIGIVSLWDLSRRRWPLAGVVFVATFLLMWTVCGQPIAALPAFIKTSLQVASGYTPTMSLSSGDRRALYGAIVTMMLGVVITARITSKRRSLAYGTLALIWLAMCVLVAKASFARFDPVHEVIAPLWAASSLPTLWAATLLFDAGTSTSAMLALMLIGGAVSSELALRHAERPGLLSSAIDVPSRVLRSIRSLANPRSALAREQRSFDAMRGEEIARTPLPQIAGTVDVYPSDVSALLSHGFSYDPRPMLQSYAAYTPRLAELNAAHLRGDKAPANLLFDIAPIDARLASMEDGLSWIEIWRRYSVSADTGGFLWLQRRPKPLGVAAPRLLSTMSATIGVPFKLPDVACGGVMAAFELRSTLRYRVGSLFWKAPELAVRLSPGDRDKRVEPTLLGTPFLISPRIETRKDFAGFMQTATVAANDARPTSAELRVLSSHPERYFAPNFSVRFFSVQPVESCGGAGAVAP